MKKSNNKWFSIIEILIWVFIFTLWLISIYVLLNSSIKMSEFSKHSIVASNLAREGVELVRFKRDNNFLDLYTWDTISSWVNFSTWVYYRVQPWNDWGVVFDEINNFTNDFSSPDMWYYRLYIDQDWNYTHNSSFDESGYYRYIKFSDVEYIDQNWDTKVIDDALKLSSYVYWYDKRPYKINIDTIITDWKR